MKFNFNVSIYQVLFSLSLIIFAIYKWQFIDLPLYWDEAWVYGPAVEEMVNNGVSLSPLAIRPEYSRGHPILFHAIVAIWLKAFGVSVSTMHSFMLFISLITFGFLFALIRLISDERAAFFGVCFVMLQPTIIEQSGQLYPEMSLALATVAACYFYYKRSFWVYFTCATAAIMIKESGIVVIIAVSLFHFISMRRSKETVLNSIQKSIKYLTPLLIWFIYLGSLKITYGWFLFPEHIGLISFNPLIVWDKIEGYFVFVFIYHGSNFLITAGLLLIIYSIYKKKKLTFIIPFQIWMLVLFLVGFIVFGALNFYSSRYMTVAFLIYAVLFSTIIFSLNQHKWLLPLMVVILFGIQFELLKNKVNDEYYMSYVNPVECHEKAIGFALDNNLKNEKFYAFFLAREIMSKPVCGYVSNDEIFTNLQSKQNDKSTYYLFSSFDTDEEEIAFQKTLNAEVIFRYEQKENWVEIKRRID